MGYWKNLELKLRMPSPNDDRTPDRTACIPRRLKVSFRDYYPQMLSVPELNCKLFNPLPENFGSRAGGDSGPSENFGSRMEGADRASR